MRLSNGFVIDKEKTFGELKFTAVRDVFLQNEDGTPSTQLKKRIYDLKCSLVAIDSPFKQKRPMLVVSRPSSILFSFPASKG